MFPAICYYTSPFGRATDRPKPLGVNLVDAGGAETEGEGGGWPKNAPWMKQLTGKAPEKA